MAEKEEDTKTVQNGYFEDWCRQGSDLCPTMLVRAVCIPLSEGWYSDQVLTTRLLTGPTAAEYKDYYKGYKTDVSNINTDKTMEFVVDGKSKKYTYKYVGKHTLTYLREIVELIYV